MMTRYINKLLFIAFFGVTFSCITENDPAYTVPETYAFQDASGNSTVDFSGQTARQNQLTELTDYMKLGNTPGTALDEAKLLEMYSNNSGLGSEYFSSNANAAGKQLRDKTARGEALIISRFENRLKALAAASATTQTATFDATYGKAGVLKSGTVQYLVDDKGAEFVQLIEKGLMGAVFYDQIQNVYLGSEKMNVDNTTPVDPQGGKFYTVMEHHWDEAYGYLTSSVNFPTTGTDKFWGKYSTTVNELLGTNTTLSLAFRTGRAAIAAGDLATRDLQIEVIRQEMEKVSAGTAIHYLNRAVTSFTDDAIRCHVLSEAAAFIEALAYTHPSTAKITGAEVVALLDQLKDNEGNYDFYNITVQEINTLRDNIANQLGFESIKSQF